MDELRELIQDYRATWEKVMNDKEDVASLNRFFHVPCTMVGADGAVSTFRAPTELQAFNTSRRDLFKKGGAVKPKLRGCDIVTLGTRCALVSANWELCRADDSVERAWRHYYNLVRTSDGWKVLLSTFAVGS